jgi:hypothetical protein
MTYTSDNPPLLESTDQLRERIPGWGIDLDSRDRPSVPRLQRPITGAHWDFPERQAENHPRERSIEHKFLTPVFGTSCPPHGVSGLIRRYAYKTYSEARAAHWLLLLVADRIDSWGSSFRSFATTRPDNPVSETGMRAEFTNQRFRSRVGRNRADTKHFWLDPIIVGGPWVSRLAVGYLVLRTIVRSRSGGRLTQRAPVVPRRIPATETRG